MTKNDFTKDDTWNGGYYELAIEVGINADEQIKTVLETILSSPKIEGYYPDRDKEPGEQQPITTMQPPFESGAHLYGLALMPNGHRIACGVCIVREEEGLDWVNIYLPMAALSQAYPVGGYPFENDRSPDNWQKSVDEWLAEMGKLVFSNMPYNLALIGFEVSGETDSKEITENGIPEERYISYLYSSGSELRRYSRNKSNSGFN